MEHSSKTLRNRTLSVWFFIFIFCCTSGSRAPFTLTNPIALVANDVIVIEISTTANSIYVQGFGFMYVDSSSN